MKKHISIERLKPGMFLVGMDQSWWNTPFFLHHRFIKNAEEIERLRKAGVRTVVIDTSKGLSDEDSEASEPLVPRGNESFGLPEQVQGGESASQQSFSPHEEKTSPSSFGTDAIREPAPDLQEIEASDSKSQDQAQRVRQAALRAVAQVFEGVQSGQPIDNPRLEETAHRIVQHVLADSQAMPQLILLQNLLAVDKSLYHHVVDVCALSVVLGIELGWEEQTLRSLALGALLHDIGYIRLPNNLVRNRRQLGESERQLLNKHAEIGHSLIVDNPDLSEDIKRIVVEHHEYPDGSGIPRGLSGEYILPSSQVVALVDQFDKATSNWGIGPSRPAALVLRNLYQEAQEGRFLMRPIERLIQCLGVYPLGSAIELSTGEEGIVVQTNPATLLKPKVKLIMDANGQPYPVPFTVDLAHPAPGAPVRSIRSLLDPHQQHIHVEKFLTVGV